MQQRSLYRINNIISTYIKILSFSRPTAVYFQKQVKNLPAHIFYSHWF